MGACSSRKSTSGASAPTMQELVAELPPLEQSAAEKVNFFNSPKLCLYMRQNATNCENLLPTLIKKMQMNAQTEECLEEVKRLCEKKSEELLRSYNVNTDQALKLMQKVLEYYQNYYQQYTSLSTDIPLVKQIIAEQSLQLSLENLIIVNGLLDKTFVTAQRWWVKEYFASRVNIIAQTYQQDNNVSVEHFSQQMLKIDAKDELVGPFLEFLHVMKSRLQLTIQMKQSLLRSINGSTQIAQNHLNQFYQNLKEGFVANQADLESSRNQKGLGPIHEEEIQSMKEANE